MPERSPLFPRLGNTVIEGQLRNASVADVCQIIASGQKTGILTVKQTVMQGVKTSQQLTEQHFEQPQAKARLHFEMGRVQFAHLVPGVHLGEVLVRMHLLTVKEVQEVQRAVHEADITSSSLGLSALRLGLLDDAELQRALEAQMLEVFMELLTWKSCSFSFAERSLLASHMPTEDATDVMTLLLEVMERLGDWEKERVEERAVFDKAADPTKLGLSEWDWEVLGYVDAERSAASIAAELELPERQVYHRLYQLAQCGAVAPLPTQAQPPVVLLCSADNLMGRLMRLALRRVGLKTCLVPSLDPERGIEAVQACRPQVLVLYDGVVGDEAPSAWPLVRALRHQAGLKHLPAVVLNSNNDGLLQRLRRPKATVLANPFDELELQQSVMRLLGRSL